MKRFNYALNGLRLAFRERSVRVHLVIAALVAVAALLLHVSATEWLAVVLCVTLVIALEIVNSAVERLATRVSAEWEREIGAVKDLAAGAVLVAGIGSAVVGCVIFIPKLLNILGVY
ncbi:MAG: diacylglycerol kinase family protein, partial [Oscillospiraceae bacterium]|nr:diacylglycerol kinase family protein [Oscillospiraceae bacterium]